MKTKLVLAALIALASPASFAQEERRLEPPPRPPGPVPPPERPLLPPEPPRAPDARWLPHNGPGSPESHRPLGPREGQPPRGPGDARDGRRHEHESDAHRPDPHPQAPGDGRPGEARPPRPAMKPTPFLGVMTAPVEPALSSQLGLAEGFGLVVQEVVPDSPAARAGLQRHDVLARLDDQQLTDPNQLAALVRAKGRDAEVALTVIRRGTEQKLTAKIDERPMPERRLLPLHLPLHEGGLRRLDRMPDDLRSHQERMEKFKNRMREFEERLRDWQKNPASGPAPQPPQLEPPPHSDADRPRMDILREVRPGGAAEIKVTKDGQTTTWNTAQARVFVKDESGELELSSEDGRRKLTVKDRHGETTFSGPIDTPEQRQALPENVRQKLEKIDARTSSGGGSASSGQRPDSSGIQ